jgi:DNA invertase Pin-like site-specific DNA recombinase
VGKIAASHLERRACVYVRQSSMAQVEHHRESGKRQYNLRERAVALGWPVERIEVIDEDQGCSGAKSEGREGFQRLVSEVALGEVGAGLGLEASRLARSCADWHRLLEIAAVSGTLIVDEEGVYDPNHYNDRLLLGLKGTLSEAELHFLKQRMIGGRRNKARRGEFRIRLPVGYVWEPGEGIRKDPDERVRDAVEFLFRTFDRLGAAHAVARFFEESGQPFPRRDGWGSPEVSVTWGALSISRVVAVLKNPIYAGVYVYDRRSENEADPEDPCAGGRIFLCGSHSGYITVEHYERNVARLVENRSLYGGMRKRGAPREGRSLLAGLVLCAVCGRHMNVTYRRDGSMIYGCRSSRTGRRCQEIRNRHVEEVVEAELLGALSHEALGLGVRALEKLAERGAELERQWQKQIEGARYEAEKAARRYHQVEPENRLVARTLEGEWNERLAELDELERRYAEVRRKPPFELTAGQREKILALAEDLPKLWRAPTTRNGQRKQIVRLLIEDVTLRNVDVPWGIDVAIRWRTGVVTRRRARRPLRHPQTTPAGAVVRIGELAHEHVDREIVHILDEEGYRNGYGKPFTAGAVAHIRQRRGWTKQLRAFSQTSPHRQT